MKVWIVENGQLALYIRKGECNRCGDCCCNHRIAYTMAVKDGNSNSDKDSSDREDWSDSEDYSIFLAQGVWWYFKVTKITKEQHICGAFDKATKFCIEWRDMDTFKPICRYWPFHPDNLEQFPKCGFRFERDEQEV